MAESRTKKASRNVLVGVLSKLIVMLLAFITKTIFIRQLGVEYNGVNGLYSNILAVLALSELGVGNVLNYSLYSALRNNNTEKVKSLVVYFKKIYYGIAFAISVIGLALVPFLKYIINSELPLDKLILYYLLFLTNSVVSYFVIYKTTVINADQNNYISSICDIVTTICVYSTEIIYLLVCKEFIGYLIIQVVFTILRNIMMNCITNRKYPYLKHLKSNTVSLESDDKRKIVDNIKSTFLYKIAAVILNNTDNILISILVGTVFVGYYSNYYLIVTYIMNFVNIFIIGITASLGSLNSEKDMEASYKMFNILCLIFTFFGTVFVCCLINCFQPFITIWIGQEHVMNYSWVIVITLNMFLATIMNPVWLFRETMGLFKQVRFILLITAGLNIVFSIILGKLFGVPGILAATFIAKLVSQYWYEPKILFSKFQKPVYLFYTNQIKQVVVMIVAAGVSMFICKFIGDSLICVILRAIVSAFIGFLFVLLFNYKSDSMNQLTNKYFRPMTRKITSKLKGVR
ncbi:lipopolysaccharide biosynthesis protein [Ruminococcus flavefaciens]|uniref:lipopolysaccharide biosynthesis protein n=1 Tax=Ruminococcus flavefaciens TaxID=1265 RepID=UPI0004B8E37F|nr:oligosaccharide flippase family protein [Ruminococcus flavefaciens]